MPAYSRALLRLAERQPDLVALDADLVLDTGLIPFQDQLPERFVECGIAEQDMVSQAGGMALAGLLPVVHSFACFLSTRPNEQIYNNATERTKVIYVGSLAGVLPSGPGHSHQSVRDISALGGVPGLVLLEPSCEAEVGLALDWCVEGGPESAYLRLVSIPYQIPFELPADYQLVPGRGVVLRDGSDAVIFGYGPVMLSEAWRAAEPAGRAGHRTPGGQPALAQPGGRRVAARDGAGPRPCLHAGQSLRGRGPGSDARRPAGGAGPGAGDRAPAVWD